MPSILNGVSLARATATARGTVTATGTTPHRAGLRHPPLWVPSPLAEAAELGAGVMGQPAATTVCALGHNKGSAG
jgi:hypothetical protein